MSSPRSKGMLPRIQPLQSAPLLDSLIKAHVKQEPDKCTGLWKTEDIEDTVENFNDFLCAVAAKGHRLSKSFLYRRLKNFFKCDHTTLEDFAAKLAQALRYCHEKSKRFTSGKKTSVAALKVIRAYGGLKQTISPSASRSDLDSPGFEDLFGDDACVLVDSQAEEEVSSDLAQGSDAEDDEALSALHAAKGMYSCYNGSAAASSSDVIDIVASPIKSSQVPHN